MQSIKQIILESILEDVAGQLWWQKVIAQLKKPPQSEPQPKAEDDDKRETA